MSLGFLIVSLVFLVLLLFIKVTKRDEEYILVTRVFSSGIGALFFYITYPLMIITLIFTLFAVLKDYLLIQRISFFIKLYFIIFLVTPFFTSLYSEYAHESGFFVYNLLAIGFLLISLAIEGFAIKNHEDNIPSDILLTKYRIIINFDYFILLISGLIIIVASFIYGDFYEFNFDVLGNIPIYYAPIVSLVFYLYNSYRTNYLSSRFYFSITNVLKSRFIYYFVSYLSISYLGDFAYSSHSFYNGLKIFRLVLFLVFIAVVIFNSFLPKIDLSFLLAIIIIILFTFEMIGWGRMISTNNDIALYIVYYLLDYIILIFIALPYYIFNGINILFLDRKQNKGE